MRIRARALKWAIPDAFSRSRGQLVHCGLDFAFARLDGQSERNLRLRVWASNPVQLSEAISRPAPEGQSERKARSRAQTGSPSAIPRSRARTGHLSAISRSRAQSGNLSATARLRAQTRDSTWAKMRGVVWISLLQGNLSAISSDWALTRSELKYGRNFALCSAGAGDPPHKSA